MEYSINEQITDAVIIPIERLINVSVSYNTDISVLTPAFRLAPGALAYSDDIEQTSLISVQDFANPVIYNVIGIDGASAQWTVSVSVDNSNIELHKNTLPDTYPNPAEDYLYIEIKENSELLEIYDLCGKLVMLQRLEYGKNVIKVSDLNKGTYLLHFSSKNKVEKLIVL